MSSFKNEAYNFLRKLKYLPVVSRCGFGYFLCVFLPTYAVKLTLKPSWLSNKELTCPSWLVRCRIRTRDYSLVVRCANRAPPQGCGSGSFW